jgi:hypothetical protein
MGAVSMDVDIAARCCYFACRLSRWFHCSPRSFAQLQGLARWKHASATRLT